MRSTLDDQVTTIVWAIIIVAVVMGAVGMWYSFGAAEAKAASAAKLRGYSLACWALAAAVYAGKWALDRFSG